MRPTILEYLLFDNGRKMALGPPFNTVLASPEEVTIFELKHSYTLLDKTDKLLVLREINDMLRKELDSLKD